MTGVLIRRGEETWRPKEDPVKMKTEIGVVQPQSKEQVGQQGRILARAFEAMGPCAHTLILDFQLLEL